MIIEVEDCQALQTLLDNGTKDPEDQKVPIRLLDTIQTIIIEEEDLQPYREEILSDLRQKNR